MLGKTHMMVGIAATTAITQPGNIKDMALAIGVGALGALISDIDVDASESHREADKITTLCVIFILAVFILDSFFHTGIIHRVVKSSGYLRIVAGILLFIGICAFGKEQPHRSFMHSFFALALLCFALGLIWNKLVAYFAVGFLSHLALDVLNKKKVKLLYPSKNGFCLYMFPAGGMANKVFLAIGSVVCVLEAIMFIKRTIL